VTDAIKLSPGRDIALHTNDFDAELAFSLSVRVSDRRCRPMAPHRSPNAARIPQIRDMATVCGNGVGHGSRGADEGSAGAGRDRCKCGRPKATNLESRLRELRPAESTAMVTGHLTAALVRYQRYDRVMMSIRAGRWSAVIFDFRLWRIHDVGALEFATFGGPPVSAPRMVGAPSEASSGGPVGLGSTAGMAWHGMALWSARAAIGV
jgi:hypothetical protein